MSTSQQPQYDYKLCFDAINSGSASLTSPAFAVTTRRKLFSWFWRNMRKNKILRGLLSDAPRAW